MQKISPQERLMFWMMHTTDWQGLRVHQNDNQMHRIAQLWTFRDATVELRLQQHVGYEVMLCTAAYLGYSDWTENACATFQQLACEWAARGGQDEVLRDVLADWRAQDAPDGSRIWQAALSKDRADVVNLLISLRLMPRHASGFRAVGACGAEACARALSTANVKTGHYDMLAGCLDAPQNKLFEARQVFYTITRASHITNDRDALFDLLEASITTHNPEGMWYLRYWTEEANLIIDHNEILSYVARRAIERNDMVLLEYIVDGAHDGNWELAEPMLWAALADGGPDIAAYLLASGVPRSSRAYDAALTHPFPASSAYVAVLLEYGVPLEDDVYETALYYAVETSGREGPLEHVCQFMDLGLAVTPKVIACAQHRDVYEALMSNVPLAQRREFQDYAFYEALAHDDDEKIAMYLDEIGIPVPATFYHRCAMLKSHNTFNRFWNQRRFVLCGVDGLEDGLAHNDYICERVCLEPHCIIDWAYVIRLARERNQQRTLEVLEAFMGKNME